MKRYIINLIVLTGLLLVSCEKQLDRTPIDTTSPEQYFNTGDDIRAALSGIYAILNSSNLYGTFLGNDDNAVTDEYVQYTNNAQGLLNLNYNAGAGAFQNIWQTCYQGIQRANLLLENIDKAPISSSYTLEEKNSIKGEALFLRAYYYYLLITRFGDVPLILNSEVDLSNLSVPESSISVIYPKITSDMKEALALVREITRYNYNSRISKSAVRGILSRVYSTWAGFPSNDVAKYDSVKYWANEVIQSGFHALNTSYAQVFINLAQDKYDIKEVLWEAEMWVDAANGPYGQGTNRFAINYGIQNNNTGVGNNLGLVYVSPMLYNEYIYDPIGRSVTSNTGTAVSTQGQDMRFEWNVATLFYGSSNPGASNTTIESYRIFGQEPYRRWLGKFRRKYENYTVKPTAGTPTNFPIMRYSDVLLLWAEADNEINGAPSQTAIDYVNYVRRRAYGKLSATTGTGGTLSGTEVVRTVTVTNGGSGYTTAPTITFSGGGASVQAQATTVITTNRVTSVTMNIYDATNRLSNTSDYPIRGVGYTSAPVVVIGNSWTPSTAYAVNTQVAHEGNLYTVTTAGTSTSTAPTHTTGASLASSTGAVFTYAGVRATATAVLSTQTEADLTATQTTPDNFRTMLRTERARELAFEGVRKQDLIRWGIYEIRVKQMATLINSISGYPITQGATIANSVTSRNLLYPIPQREINLNKALTQNPGW